MLVLGSRGAARLGVLPLAIARGRHRRGISNSITVVFLAIVVNDLAVPLGHQQVPADSAMSLSHQQVAVLQNDKEYSQLNGLHK